MIISRTPLRISFVGGGTDLPDFYRKDRGAVLSTAIDKYMYITVNRFFDHRLLLKYSKTELVESVEAVEHPLLKACLKLTGITGGTEITSMCDVLGGTGLGSSSAFTVGTLHALHAYKGEFVSAEQLAQEACRIEIEMLKEPIGKQDQYIASYGGCKYIQFMPDESVWVDPVICPPEILAELKRKLLLFYTGVTRKASAILKKQKRRTQSKFKELKSLRSLAEQARKYLNLHQVDKFGKLLHENWTLKKKLAPGISNSGIDEIYERARKAGAIGGKILGAGGGGFLLVFCHDHSQSSVRQALNGLREIPFELESQGSKIIYVS
ncbi:MAG: GHMP kinase [Elusimicrobia bacterium RIFCSPLOWO2_12_FULL_59_9]|nr:MAG: GHMP kinase [Elusimicrobia bacterium RIFCSPLOWO2_12_FULL_59_9]